MGNENIHSLTSSDSYILKIDMEAFNGETSFAEYDGFSIDDESNDYTLRFTAYLGSSTAGKFISIDIFQISLCNRIFRSNIS